MKPSHYFINTTLNINHERLSGLVEGLNCSLQEYLRCNINGNDTKYTEWSTDLKLLPLAYNSQITTTLGLSPYEMVFH